MSKNPVTALAVASISLSNGTKFQLVHDILDETLWKNHFDRWLRKTKRYTADSLIAYIKSKKPHGICVTQAQYDEVTKGKAVKATKEEYETENPSVA